jgi:Tol biopolymer transport system component
MGSERRQQGERHQRQRDGRQPPAFSADGTKIAFNSNRPNGNPTAVYLVGANGGAVSRLATSSGFDNDPDWGALDVAAPEVARVTPAEGTRNVSRRPT